MAEFSPLAMVGVYILAFNAGFNFDFGQFLGWIPLLSMQRQMSQTIANSIARSPRKFCKWESFDIVYFIA